MFEDFSVFPIIGPKVVLSWGHMFYIGLYRKNLSETIRPRALILCTCM